MMNPPMILNTRIQPVARVWEAATPLFLGFSLLVLAACSSLPTEVHRTPSYKLADTSQTALYADIASRAAAHPDESGFHMLNKGIEAFAARIRIIEAAQASIDAQYYIWHDDLTGQVMNNRLLVAADRGVRVRMLLDDLDTAGKDQLLHLIDSHPNIEVRVYNPFANRDLRAGDFVTDTSRVNHRMHNKTLTVDNAVTIFGGRNIGDEYFDAADEVGFSDMDALAIGPIADEVSDQFDLYWNSEWVYPISAFESPEPVDDAAIDAFRELSDQHLADANTSRYADSIRDLSLLQASSITGLEYVWSDWILAFDQPSKVEAQEVSIETHLGPRLKRGMDRAKEELLIVSPYFVPGEKFSEYLVGRVAEGVTVKVLTNSLSANDVSLVHAGYMRYREQLVAGGVELYEFRAVGNNRQANGKRSNKLKGSRSSLHAKFFGFDQTYMFIGSFNLDARSVELNTELGAYFRSPQYAQRLSEGFGKAQNVAYRVQLDADDDLEWVTLLDGQEHRYDKEPDTGFWQRFNARVMSWLVPESQL